MASIPRVADRARSAGGGEPPSPRRQSPQRAAARAAQRQVRRDEGRVRRVARRSVLWRHRRALYVLGLIGLAAAAGAGAVLSRLQPPPEGALVQTSWICLADVTADCGPDNAVAALSAEEDRQVVEYSVIPSVLVDAVVAAEDRDFFRHTGVDPSGIARAVWRDLQGDGVLQGGSTITQQYVKNAYLTPERSVIRKLREGVLALKIERKYTKAEILQRYLNRIYFGRGAYGVQAASKAYFGKNVDQLDLAEAAYLAGLIRSPETADASIDPSEADFRRDSVLDAMVEEAMITPEAAEEARSIPWTTMVLPRRDRSGLDIRFDRGCGMEYVIDWVRQQLLESYGNRIYTDGLRVHLTIDPERQCAAYDALYSQTLDDADTDPDASLVALDEQRNVVALVGGRDYSVSQVNLALGRLGGGSGRQAGSAFKPIVLAEAIRQGISPLSKYPAPAELVIPEADDGEDWKVTGGGSAGGGYTLLDATRVSSNTVYAQLMMEVGPENVANLARGLGITSELPPIPALVLGVPEVSVLDMASVYATLANAGEHLPPRIIDRVVGPGGALEPLPPREATFPLTQAETGEVTAALVDVVERGTGQQARLDLPAAGKTGTTDDYRDAWFVGYTCDLTAAVWMGYSGRDGQPVRSMRDVRSVDRVEGGTFPAQMWARFMSTAARGGEGCLYVDRDYDGRVLRPELSTSAPTEDSSASTTTETSSAAPTSTTAPAPTAPTSRPGSPSPSSSPPPTSSTTAPPATPVEPTTTGATTTTSPVPEPPSSTAGTTVSTVAAQPGAGPGG